MNQVPSSLFPAETARVRKVGKPSDSTKAPPRFDALRSVPWRNAAKLMLSGVVVAGLAWLGARNAASEPPPPLDGVVAVAASSAPSATASAGHRGEGNLADGGAPASGTSSAPAPGVLPDGRVVLNLASAEDLRKLPGVGASRAEAILALRARLGRFRSPRDLLRVRGIGIKTLRRMEPKLVLDPPPVPDADAG